MPLAGPILTRIIIYVVLALGLFGGWKLYLSHVKNQGKQEVVAEVTANALANKTAAEAASAALAAEHVKTEDALRRKLAAIRSAKADACSKAPALPEILEGLK